MKIRALKASAAIALTGLLAAGTLTACSSSAPSADSGGGRGPISFASGSIDLGNLQPLIDQWNSDHPDEKVEGIDLGAAADQQRQLMIQNAQTKSDAYTVLNLDVIWGGEFAANQWIDELDAADYNIDALAGVDAGTYRDKLYAVPWNIEGGVFFYRTDLLQAAGIAAPPTSWAEMVDDCAAIQATPEGAGVNCYTGQFDKYEGLTVNFAEAVSSAGGHIYDDAGKPDVNTPEAMEGLTALVDGFKTGMIPQEAITFKEEEGRQAFQEGKFVFHRQWSYQYSLANATDGSSQVAGKFDITTIPGIGDHPGVSSLGGHMLSVSKFGKNKDTARDFIAFITSEDSQREVLDTSGTAVATSSLYTDPALVAKYPHLPVLQKSNDTAVPRPVVVNYGEVTAAIQDQAYAAITMEKSPKDALEDLQTALEGLAPTGSN